MPLAATSANAINLALGRLSKKVHARSVPVIVEVRSLDGMGGEVGVDQSLA